MTDIGSQLRAAREAQGLTLEQVFKATRIKQSFPEAIEANQLTDSVRSVFLLRLRFGCQTDLYCL